MADANRRSDGLRVGLRLPQYATTWPHVVAAAQQAESLGFAHLWVNDHLRTPGRLGGDPAFDAFTTLAALAPLTTRAHLGIAVASASYRPPALAAKMATVLDTISGGRLILGIGAGSDEAEHAAYGIPFGSRSKRTEGVERMLAVIEALTSSPEGADLPGVLAGAANRPPPVQTPRFPVWVAAHGPRLLAHAGAHADGVVAAFLSPRELADRREVAERARTAAGRQPLRYALYTYALAGSEDDLEAWIAPEARAQGTSPAGLLRWLRTTGIAGTPAEVRRSLDEHRRAGATDVILVMPNRTPDDALEALAEAVLAGSAVAAPSAARRGPGDVRSGLAWTLVEKHRHAGAGHVTAVSDESGEWTYDELGRAAARAAGALAARGVRRGDRVIVALRDGRPWCAAALGASWLGAAFVPIDPDAPPERTADVIDDCEPTAVVVDEGAAIDAITLGPHDLDGEERSIAPVVDQALAYLVYSSGSTGRPKAVMHAHRDLHSSIEGYSREILELGPGERSHSVARLYTSLGFGNGFFRPLGRGATCVMTSALPTVRTVASACAERGVSVLTAVPTFWSQLARFLERHPDAWQAPALRLAVSSGDGLPKPVAERIRAAIGVPVIEGLGCSECSNVVLSTRAGDDAGGIGRPTAGCEIRLVDEDGRDVPPGTPGRLMIRTASATTGYWRRAEETRELIVGEWLRMGDVLEERDGRFAHLGRVDDLFKVDARWVAPTAVEDVLLEHEMVAEVAVVGRPGPDGLVRASAVVVLSPGARLSDRLVDDLRRSVARGVAPHAAPATVTAVDALPHLPSGKVDRRALRRR